MAMRSWAIYELYNMLNQQCGLECNFLVSIYSTHIQGVRFVSEYSKLLHKLYSRKRKSLVVADKRDCASRSFARKRRWSQMHRHVRTHILIVWLASSIVWSLHIHVSGWDHFIIPRNTCINNNKLILCNVFPWVCFRPSERSVRVSVSASGKMLFCEWIPFLWPLKFMTFIRKKMP